MVPYLGIGLPVQAERVDVRAAGKVPLRAPGPNFDDVRLHRLGCPFRPRLARRQHEVSPANPGSFRNLEVRAARRGLETAVAIALEAQLALPSPVRHELRHAR